MNPAEEQGRRRGFFITAFGPRAQFVQQALQREADKADATLETLPASGKRPNLLERLTESLRNSDFVVVDLSPADLVGGNFNANVMFEYGRAVELEKPIFSICDEEVLGRLERLPFDISPIETIKYSLHPEGLLDIAKKFGDWLRGNERLRRYALAHNRLEELVKFRDDFISWKEPTMHLFGPVIDVVTDRLRTYADRINNVNERLEGYLPFDPLRRQDMIEAVFCATLNSMEASDDYDTVSTVEFWREIRGGSGTADTTTHFLTETGKALRRGVHTRRLFLVPGWDISNVRPYVPVLKQHEYLRAEYLGKYDLGYYIVHGEREYHELRHKLHVGVCRVKSKGVDFVLRPKYDGGRWGYGPERLTSLDYALGTTPADASKHDIDTLWDSGRQHGVQLLENWADVEEVLKPSHE